MNDAVYINKIQKSFIMDHSHLELKNWILLDLLEYDWIIQYFSILEFKFESMGLSSQSSSWFMFHLGFVAKQVAQKVSSTLLFSWLLISPSESIQKRWNSSGRSWILAASSSETSQKRWKSWRWSSILVVVSSGQSTEKRCKSASSTLSSHQSVKRTLTSRSTQKPLRSLHKSSYSSLLFFSQNLSDKRFNRIGKKSEVVSRCKVDHHSRVFGKHINELVVSLWLDRDGKGDNC